ncbi:phosphoribosylformylglycinamidine cyclo-ligase [candidate division KSB1 bacterium]|nr:phosphoribosylformylglycinamidine cyclo-ligase [candidate division KSB1 bacterium]
MAITYEDAGVNLSAADESTSKISALAKSTFGPEVLRDIGLFAGFYQPEWQAYKNPILVSSIDGVGTKLKIAFMLNRHDTVGQDLVNHCVNDIMTSGADPLFFLDYIGAQKLLPQSAESIIAGMAKACQENRCALIGGETAEMPGFYSPGEYDLAGCIVGIVDKETIIDGSRIQSGDDLIGLRSNGFHTNGYSLIRKVLLEIKSVDLQGFVQELGGSWGDVLLKIHRSYRSIVAVLRESPAVVGISHITGGGIAGNTRRLLRQGLDLDIDWNAWEWPSEFQQIQILGEIPTEEMRRVFNLGIGLLLVVRSDQSEKLRQKLTQLGEESILMGKVVDREE